VYRDGTPTPVATVESMPGPPFIGPETPGASAFYSLSAVNASGESVRSMAVTVHPALYPGAPVSLFPEPSDAAITLSWPTPEGDAAPTGYNIYRSTASGGVKTLLEALPQPTPRHVDAQVTPGRAYYYQVSSKNAVGEGALSPEKGALAASGPSVSITPLSSRNNLSWAPVLPASTHQVAGYAVYRAQVPATVFTQIGSVVSGAAASQFADTAIVSGLEYIYRVAPSTSLGVLGGFSLPATQKVLPRPVNLSRVTGDAMVQLRWDYQGGGGTTYRVWRRLGTQDDLDFQVLVSGLTGIDYTDTGVVNKTAYAYRVETVASSGLTAMSPVVFALPAKPPVVTNGTVTALPRQGGVTLSWAPPANSGSGGFDPKNQYPLAGYRIYRSLDGGGTYQFAGQVPADLNGYFDLVDTLSGNSFTYLVRAYDVPPDDPEAFHETPYPPVTVESLGAGTALDRNALRPFGLPHEREVNLRMIVTEPGRVTIKIYSLSGTFVKSLVDRVYGAGVHWEKWDGTNRDGRRVASGVYLVITEMPNKREAAKIAVVK
jgi:hypothetical protein